MALCKCGCGGETRISSRNHRGKGWITGQPRNYIHGHNPIVPFLQRMFNMWSRVNVFTGSDCIEWNGQLSTNGYGTYIPLFNTKQAHRIAYILTFGPIPPELELDHLCRNRKCVNPYHLEPVTRTVNTHRGARAKLTMDKAVEIRNSLETNRAIARRMGVHSSTINAVRTGRTWHE